MKPSFLPRLLAALLMAAPAAAEDPVPIEKVADVDVLVVEADDRIKELDKLLADEASYEKSTELALPTAAGVLACIGHAVAQHPDGKTAEMKPLALRDAALELAEAGDLEEARAAAEKVKQARKGGGEGSELDDQTWYDLIPSYELMEEINTRNSKLVRISRRPRGNPDEVANAAVIALLCLPMHAQAEDYVDGEDLKDYRSLVLQYMNETAELGQAVKAKDGPKVKQLLLASKQSCDTCHKKYRDGE